MDVGWNATDGMMLVENNLTNAGPSLVSVPNDRSPATDFALKRTSPAWGLGFKEIPVEQIGLRDDELRRGLKRLTGAGKP